MTILKVLTEPDPILRQKALPVDSVDKNIQKLLDDMLETMYEDNGVGLAANQVGELKRILVIDLQKDDEEKRPKDFYPLYVVNPEIIEASDEMVEADEGCLSLPGLRIPVIRHEKIKLKYLDYHNKQQELEVSGWIARVFQHEMDHLDGKLAIDYLSKLKKEVAIRKLKKIKRLAS